MAQFSESEKGPCRKAACTECNNSADLLSQAARAEREARALLLSNQLPSRVPSAAATVTEPDPPPRARSRCARGVVRRGGGTQMAHRLMFSTTTPSQPNLIARTS